MLDIEYKKALAEHLNIDDLNMLSSIVGEDEFKIILSNLNNNSYSPDAIKTNSFCANLHCHTVFSDGNSNADEILDNALEFAQKRNNYKLPFIIGITDHDTIGGCIEILNILKTNYKKYKLLKIVLGIEISTTEKSLEYLNNTLDIHTLFYCINPFDRKLTNFINKKANLKYELALKTLENIKSVLNEDLKKLNIKLSLQEAAKIHPMILKGQDEISHPLKKYLFAKMLFSYYVENNKNLITRLKRKNIETSLLSYEQPVKAYKKLFNNERYFFIYKNVLEKYVSNLLQESISLPEIPDWLYLALLKAKSICEQSHPHPCIENKLDAFSPFLDTVEFLSQQKYGLISIAHPARINTKNINIPAETFFNDLFLNFTKYGKEKAYAYEKYYQSYTSDKSKLLCSDIDAAAAKYHLHPTGGIDSHGNNVYTR